MEHQEEPTGRSFEQRMTNYRQRIRYKLQARGASGDGLHRQTEELMNRTSPFDLSSLMPSVMTD